MDELHETLMGGQSFSWSKNNDTYEAVLNNRVYRIKSLEDAKSDPFLKNYFDLDYDYEEARRILSAKDEHLALAVEMFPHLRILRQDLWTTLISFIISQNNNIKRIKMIYDRLCKAYGREVEPGYYTFPTAEEMKDVTAEDLRALGTGFRDKYIVDAIRHSDILLDLDTLSFEEASKRLQEIKGIGEKVASCVLLFGMHRSEAFPVDVWMKRVLALWYPELEDLSYFEPNRALAQQYLFSYSRAINLKV